jgi:hypothetical protein
MSLLKAREGRGISLKAAAGELLLKRWQLISLLYVVFLALHALDFKFRISVDGYYRVFLNDPAAELINGRFANYLLGTAYNALGINIVLHQQIFFFLFIGLLAISAYIVIACLMRYFKDAIKLAVLSSRA